MIRSWHIAVLLILSLLYYRLDSVGVIPAGFFCDEASIAFNARSIAETGLDEHGKSMPVFFKAFGEYKPPLYIYSTSLSQALFDDIHFATRLPAALYLSAFLFVLFLIAADRYRPFVGIAVVLCSGVDPWFNHFSHIAFGLVLIPFLLSLALYFWIRGVHGKSWGIELSAVFFSLAFYSYPPARVFVPLISLCLIVIYWHDLHSSTMSRWRRLFRFFSIAFLCSLPFQYYLFFEADFLSRVGYLNIMSTPFLKHNSSYRWLEKMIGGTVYADWLFDKDQRWILRPVLMVLNYCSYLSPKYLFFSADRNMRFGNSHFGVFSCATMILMALGLLQILVRRNKFDRVLLCWLLLFAVPAALTWEDIPHSGRGIVAHPGLELITATGISTLLRLVESRKRLTCVFSFIIISAVFGAFFNHLERYPTYYKTKYSRHSKGWMQYGFREMMKYIEEHHSKYNKVWVVSKGLLYEPHIFALLYSKMDPSVWQQAGKLPWNMEIVKRKLNPENIRKGDLYMFAPPPRDLDKRFVQVENFDRSSVPGAPRFHFFEVLEEQKD